MATEKERKMPPGWPPKGCPKVVPLLGPDDFCKRGYTGGFGTHDLHGWLSWVFFSRSTPPTLDNDVWQRLEAIMLRVIADISKDRPYSCLELDSVLHWVDSRETTDQDQSLAWSGTMLGFGYPQLDLIPRGEIKALPPRPGSRSASEIVNISTQNVVD